MNTSLIQNFVTNETQTTSKFGFKKSQLTEKQKEFLMYQSSNKLIYISTKLIIDKNKLERKISTMVISDELMKNETLMFLPIKLPTTESTNPIEYIGIIYNYLHEYLKPENSRTKYKRIKLDT